MEAQIIGHALGGRKRPSAPPASMVTGGSRRRFAFRARSAGIGCEAVVRRSFGRPLVARRRRLTGLRR